MLHIVTLSTLSFRFNGQKLQVCKNSLTYRHVEVLVLRPPCGAKFILIIGIMKNYAAFCNISQSQFPLNALKLPTAVWGLMEPAAPKTSG